MAAKTVTRVKADPAQDFITNKILIVFTATFLGIMGLMLLYRGLVHGNTFTVAYFILRALCVLSWAGTVVGLVMVYLEKSKKKNMAMKYLTGASVGCFSFVVAICTTTLLSYNFTQSIKYLYVLLPVLAIFHLIFHSYQREFFLTALGAAVTAAALYVAGKLGLNGEGMMQTMLVGAAIVALLLLVIFVALLSKNHGKINLGSEKKSFAPADMHYKTVTLSLAVMIVLLLSVFVLPASYAFYMMYAVFAYLFAAAVYYTVKMM